jgi:hypothetical protein
MQSSTEDKSLQFKLAVVSNFQFLEANHGFSRRSSRPQKWTQLVIYENLQLYVILGYGPPDYEPEMSFGRRGIDDLPGAYSFHPGDLVQLDCCRNWTWNKDGGNALGAWVADLARLLDVCGAQCLAGDQLVFAQMKARRDRLVADWKKDEKLKDVRAQIEPAWKAKDYRLVLQLYEAIDELSDLDKRRIAFAKAHV